MGAGRDIGAVLHETSRLLSSVSHYTGIVLAPRFSATIFRHIEFVKLGGRRILAILVADNGAVQNRLIESDEEFSSEELIRMSNYLNELLVGVPVGQVRMRMLEEMRNEKVLYDKLLARALQFSEQSLNDDGAQIFIEGQTNILEQPEFADSRRMRIFSGRSRKRINWWGSWTGASMPRASRSSSAPKPISARWRD